jgi:hypothetical protein
MRRKSSAVGATAHGRFLVPAIGLASIELVACGLQRFGLEESILGVDSGAALVDAGMDSATPDDTDSGASQNKRSSDPSVIAPADTMRNDASRDTLGAAVRGPGQSAGDAADDHQQGDESAASESGPGDAYAPDTETDADGSQGIAPTMHPTANPCATPGATYLEHYDELANGSCGPLADDIFNVAPDGTLTTAAPISCETASQTGCTARNSGCAAQLNGSTCMVTTDVTFMSDGSSASGVLTFSCSNGIRSCESTYQYTATRM